MEQKTEASKAVDEPVLPHLPRAVGYRHTMDNTEGIKGNKPVVVFCATKPNPFGIPGLDYSASFPVTTETLFTADQMKEYARAALKAQPAPTEVQGEPFAWGHDDFGAVELSRVRRVGWFPLYRGALPKDEPKVQGEDSARLDAERLPMMNPACGCEACNPQMIGRMMFICKLCGDKRCPHVANHVNPCQGHARASAETGGVKP